MAAPTSDTRERALILASLGRDGVLAHDALSQAGIAAEVCAGIEGLCSSIATGAGVVLLTEESLTPSAAQLLLETLHREPPWSDLPLVVLTTSEQRTGALSLRTLQRLGPHANVSFLERPLRTITLVAAVRAALRARRRQYDVRDYLAIRERIEAALREANDEAERASRAKDHFLAMLAHELRNPLAAIVNGLAVLDRVSPSPPPEAEKESRAVISRQVHHLTHLIDDLLDVSRIISGKISLQRAPVDLREAVRQSIESRQASAGRSHEMSLLADARPLIVDGDPVRLEQIVGNLLDNAVKYSPPGEPIRVLVHQEDGQAVLRVQDRGIGLAADMLKSIFEPFTQIDTSLHRARGGLGLGLAVARGLVEQHGGCLTAHSAGLGEGSEFVVRLPLSDMAPRPPEPALASAPARRIVVVEDNADARDMLQTLLRLDGHHVEVAADGRAGLALILEAKPDVALIDVGLPELDGYEVARQVRRTMGSPTIRLIAVTGYGQSHDRAHAQEAGFDVHLTKPIDPEELTRALAGC